MTLHLLDHAWRSRERPLISQSTQLADYTIPRNLSANSATPWSIM
jgi:hypothetical protein